VFEDCCYTVKEETKITLGRKKLDSGVHTDTVVVVVVVVVEIVVAVAADVGAVLHTVAVVVVAEVVAVVAVDNEVVDIAVLVGMYGSVAVAGYGLEAAVDDDFDDDLVGIAVAAVVVFVYHFPVLVVIQVSHLKLDSTA
jgi:hypothetical protein